MLAGPMDYTQGAMINGTQTTYAPNNSRPMSQGTRTHQLAQYVVFLSPLNMLCDSPTHYNQEEECTRFIVSVPTVWDETIPLKSEIGEYVAVARRKDGKWFVGALTNWTARDLTLDLSPLNIAGRQADAFYDGINATVRQKTTSAARLPSRGRQAQGAPRPRRWICHGGRVGERHYLRHGGTPRYRASGVAYGFARLPRGRY